MGDLGSVPPASSRRRGRKNRRRHVHSFDCTNETVIGTRPVHFRYRLRKESCNAAEFPRRKNDQGRQPG
ncbi:hypothetical protein BW45_14430 [Agrobacterium tumefaciens]|nr:hypothetical protein BW45_14430 [Agrobacterium tumefaciens]